MGFLENLTNDAFANKMADHYHTHIGAAEFKSIRDEAKSGANPQTPPWGAQPYIQRGMRGGLNKLTAPVIDAIRVGGFMASPKGLLFIAKQTGLQRSNPLGEFGVNPIHSSRKYNPLSMIDQVLRGPLGTHIDRHGGGTTNLEDLNYENRIKKLNRDSPTSNRLVAIASQLDVGYHRSLDLSPSETIIFNKTISRKKWSNKSRPGVPIEIAAMTGPGGPNSFFGIGTTTHRAFLPNNRNINIYYKPPSENTEAGNPGPDSYSKKKPEGDYKELGESKDYLFDPTGKKLGVKKGRSDFDGNTYKPPKNSTEPGNPGDDSYSKKHPEGQVKGDRDYFFDPTGKKLGSKKGRSDYDGNTYKPPHRPTEPGNPGDDSYSKMYPEGHYKALSDNVDTFLPTKTPAGSTENTLAKYQALSYGGIVRAGKDTSYPSIKSFSTKGGRGTRYKTGRSAYSRLGLIDYGKVQGGTKASTDEYGEDKNTKGDFVTLKLEQGEEDVKFRSYGLGSITDNTSFSWTEVKSAGRTMAQQKFDSVARDISHDLMIVAFTAAELKQNYIRLNKLYQMASPSLSGGLATAPFCKFTLGDLYDGVNVIIDKITFTVDDSTPWDIGFGKKGVETKEKELPMIIKLNLGYKLLTNADGNFFSSTSNYWTAFNG